MRKTLLLPVAVAASAVCGMAFAGSNTGGASVVRAGVVHAPAVTSAGVGVDTSPGTGAPPATLGGFNMDKVQNHTCTGTTPPIPSPSGGTIDVQPNDGERCIGASWATWSNGYAGYVYYSVGSTTQTITLPAGTKAFYFYVEPNPFSVQTCSATSGATSTGPLSVDGSGGAAYIGFYGTGGGSLSSVTVTCDTDFATGEFGISSVDICDMNGNGKRGQFGDAIMWYKACKAGTLPLSSCDLDGSGAFKFADFKAWKAKCKSSADITEE